MNQRFTLLELNKSIQEQINLGFPKNLWVIAEVSELKVNRNGHCYVELIEKDAVNDHIIAKSRATIWAFTYRMLRPYFESITGRDLSPGLKLLVQVKVEFHELYGFSLNITDIDPNYTLGDLAQKKAEILNQLNADGVINLNKDLDFPQVPQKIAIISSETAAGFQDFMDQLENNVYGFKFYTKLYQSVMQGNQAENSIIIALEKIYEQEDFFDLVVIIRGGGSQADLSCFDSYLLGANIAQFPLPVITGIGHEKDESIADVVAHKKLKTPTAVAEYIIEKTARFEEGIVNIQETVLDLFFDQVQVQREKLNQLARITVPSVKNSLSNQHHKLTLTLEKLKTNTFLYTKVKDTNLKQLKKYLPQITRKLIHRNQEMMLASVIKLKTNCHFIVKSESKSLKNAENRLSLLDPKNILKRGYSITYHKGEVLKDSRTVRPEDDIKTKLLSGTIRSKVKGKKEN